jgi:hypothetical protein
VARIQPCDDNCNGFSGEFRDLSPPFGNRQIIDRFPDDPSHRRGPEPMIAGWSRTMWAASHIIWVRSRLQSHRMWAGKCDNLGPERR